MLQSVKNTLVCAVERQGRVQLSFSGGLDLRRIHEPEPALGNRVQVASLLDLAGCKVAVDIAAVMMAGIDLPTALAAGVAV